MCKNTRKDEEIRNDLHGNDLPDCFVSDAVESSLTKGERSRNAIPSAIKTETPPVTRGKVAATRPHILYIYTRQETSSISSLRNPVFKYFKRDIMKA